LASRAASPGDEGVRAAREPADRDRTARQPRPYVPVSSPTPSR
jgi:hypothetical protein